MKTTVLHTTAHENFSKAVLTLEPDLVAGDYLSIHAFTDTNSSDAAMRDRLLVSLDVADILLIDRDSLSSLTGKIALQGAYEANIWSLAFTGAMHLFEVQRPPRLWAFRNYYLPQRGLVAAEAMK